MANPHEIHTVVDSSKLPEQLRGFHGLGLDENNRLVGLDADGNLHSIKSISRVALAGFHEAGGIGTDSQESQLQKLSEAVNNLQTELEAERTQRAGERTELLGQIEALQARLDANDPLKRTFELGDEIQIRNAENNIEGGWAVASGVWTREEGGETVDYVTVIKDGTIDQKKLEDLRQWQTEDGPTNPAEGDPPIPPNQDDPPQQGRIRRLRDRATVATGNILTGGRSVEVRETNRRRRIIGGLIGGTAIAATAIAAWELVVEPKFFGHSHSREVRQHFQDQLTQIQAQNAADKARDAAEKTQDAANAKLATARFNTLEHGITANAQAIAAEKAQEAADKAQILARINEVHNSGLRADHGILKQVHEINVREHSEAIGAGHGGHAATVAGKTTEAGLHYRGDAVEKEVAKNLKLKGYLTNLSLTERAQRIHTATNNTLRLNHLRWNGGGWGKDAHKLPIGYRFKLPNFAQMFKK